MLVYSHKIIAFVTEIKKLVKRILTQEIGLNVHGDRFYNDKRRASYPLKIVIYNETRTLGYFDSNFLELGFHESLMHASKTQLNNIIRHELAHYLTYIYYGEGIKPHGAEYKAICQKFGWGKEISEATATLEEAELGESSILRKVQKLMALSTSSNKHEAELAMLKSRELLLKHNIGAHTIEESSEEKMYLKRILKQKRITAKLEAIGRILETFFVSVVYHKGKEHLYLDVLGERANVEIAEYVANVLDVQLEELWNQTSLSGITAKNSFFLGLAKGYCLKTNALKKEYSSATSKALLVIEKQLTLAKEMAYSRLTQSKSTRGYCSKSAGVGEQMGKNLKINPGVSANYSGSTKFLE